MDSETIDAVTDWETVPVEDGYRGLHALADAEFTGAVTDGRAWAFVLNGRVIGIFEGDVEAFEGAALTAYGSPDPALPLLYAMQERGGTTQAKYYTQQMALSEADETLRSGGFTGYVRLSENVLSGDYYVVYHGGKSMSVAFVGASRRLLTGDEAFQRANDEVGIFEVIDADVDVTDLPDPPEADPKSESESDVEAEAKEETEARPDADAADVGSDSDANASTDAKAADETARSTTFGGVDFDADDATADASTAEPTAASDADPPEPTSAETDADAESEGDDADSAADAPSELSESSEPPEAADGDDPADAAEASEDDADVPDDVFSEEEEWREARAIPSLDPAQTEAEGGTGRSAARGRSDAARRGATAETKTRSRDDPPSARRRRTPSPPQSVSRSSGDDSDADTRSSDAPSRSVRPKSNAESSGGSSPVPASASESTDDDSDLRERLAEATAARERLESERDELEAERDEYREEAERLASKVDALEAEIERLESALADASAAAGDGSDAPERTMSAAEALSGTNLFVRYASKADPTLADAHGGDARRDEVNDNLRVEHHTQFDTDGLHVEGRPFEEYLRDTTEYRFVEWVVRDLLYDVQATRARSELGDLYDAIPRIDRVEIGGTVSATDGQSGGDDEAEDAGREAEVFDVVLWDGRGNPLVVANLNTSRDPATESMVTSLIADASAVGESHDTLGAAFYVTASYFEPGALDAVGDATGGGLLSRSKRRSYVKLARKQGFHLCLVEARNREFHVSVPDL